MSGDILQAAIDQLKKLTAQVASETSRVTPGSLPEKKEPFGYGYSCGRFQGLLEAEKILQKVLDGEDQDDIDK